MTHLQDLRRSGASLACVPPVFDEFVPYSHERELVGDIRAVGDLVVLGERAVKCQPQSPERLDSALTVQHGCQEEEVGKIEEPGGTLSKQIELPPISLKNIADGVLPAINDPLVEQPDGLKG